MGNIEEKVCDLILQMKVVDVTFIFILLISNYWGFGVLGLNVNLEGYYGPHDTKDNCRQDPSEYKCIKGIVL